MKRIVLLIAFATLLQARPEEDKKDCKDELVKEVLKTGMDRPFMLSYDKHHHEIIFSFTNLETNRTNDDIFEIGTLSLKDKTYRRIKNIKNGFATAVSHHDGKDNVYIGSEKGLYKLNRTTHEAEHYGGESNIWYIFIDNGTIYYTDYPKRELKHLKDGKESLVKNFADKEVILYIEDAGGYTYFTNKTGLYVIASGSEEVSILNHGTDFRGVTLDRNGEANFGGHDGVYIYDKEEKKLVLSVDLPDLFGLTYDSDNNLIYSTSKEILKLVNKC